MTNNSYEFSREHLEMVYRTSLDAGYTSLIFGEEEAAGEKPFILWRHDIDLELPAVTALARLEARIGIRSTYFFMTRSWFYNLLSREGGETLAAVRDLGHCVGLHCDLHAPRDATLSDEAVGSAVAREFQILDAAYPGIFSRTVSFHNPPTCVLRKEYCGFYSTYHPKFFGTIKYLSDSNRIWREGAIESWLDTAKTPRMSILLHPVIWSYPGSTMPQGMSSFIETRSERTRQMLIADDVRV